MRIEQKLFGVTRAGAKAYLYTIENSQGMRVVLTNYGAILVSILLPDADGVLQDLVLGYDTLAEYEAGGFFGATVGRNANRISGAAFTLDDKHYSLVDNDGGNNLHSDFIYGFHKQLWNMEQLPNGVRFFRLSPDGECGFPGDLRISVSYLLEEDNSLHILYEGVSNQKTLINLTNHSFFNLAGHDGGSILTENLTLFCEHFLEIREGKIPTGQILPVTNTPMDFRENRAIGAAIDTDWRQLRIASGYDHCWVTASQPGRLKRIAFVEDLRVQRRMEVLTDLPGVQFYTANSLPIQRGKSGAVYGPRCAFCLETEYWPDNVHFPHFPQSVFGAGETYRAETVYRFSQI